MNSEKFNDLITDKGKYGFVESSAGIEKYKILFSFVSKNKLKIKRIASMGGGYFDYKILSFLFPKSYILTINKNKADMKGCPNQKISDIENDEIEIKNKFDLIFCADTIEHLINPDNFLKNVNNISNKGSVFILTTPNLASWMNRLFLLFGYSPSNYDVSYQYKLGNPFASQSSAGQKTVFTPRSLSELLQKHGFKVIFRKGYGYTEKVKKMRIIRLLLNKILPDSMKEGIFIASRKMK